MEQTRSQTAEPRRRPPPQPLRQRNSIAATIPSKVLIPTTTKHPPHTSLSIPNGTRAVTTTTSPKSPSTSFTSYTSLKDILPTPSTINSPTAAASAAAAAAAAAAASSSYYEIPIRNRLVKQAAWAYLQPKSSPVGSTDSNILYRVWLRFCDCLNFMKCHLVSVFSQLLRTFTVFRESR